jgi:hypothetical protein
VGTGRKEDKSSTGRFWVTGFHHVTLGARFVAYEPCICINLSLLMSYIYGAPSKARNLTSYIFGRIFYWGFCFLNREFR